MFGKSVFFATCVALAGTTHAGDLSLEPCINADVSASGNFPTQLMEEQIQAYLDWRSYEPYYLFAVAANYLQTPFDEGAAGDQAD